MDILDFTRQTELCEIMGNMGSDKSNLCKKNWHNYTLYYDSIFKDLKYKPLRVFELGIGTNNTSLKSNMGSDGIPGASLQGWKQYFENSEIFGADIDKDILFQEPRIKTFYCDQTSKASIESMWLNDDLKEPFDIIIEDGLHTFDANKCFFENSIHKIKKGGIYIIEDINLKSIHLYKEQITIWETIFPDCSFSIVKLPHERNIYDNCLIKIQKQ